MNRLSKFKLPFLLTISLSAVFPQAGLKIKADNVQVQEDESVKINVLKRNKDTVLIRMKLMEGKNREIRKIINFFGWGINRLQRISFGPIQLNNLKKNEIKEINIKKYFKKIP